MISVIIPTYKEPEYLDLCLESAFKGQTEDNEIIVSGLGEKIEIWSKARYSQSVLDDTEDFEFGDLAEEVRRDLETGNEN